MKIRKFSLHDINSLVDVFTKAYSSPPWNECWTVETAEKRLMSFINIPSSTCLVAENDGEILGCAMMLSFPWYSGCQIELKELFVLPAYQARGIGSRLLEEIEKIAIQNCCKQIIVTTLQTKDLTDFYKRRGFQEKVYSVSLVKELNCVKAVEPTGLTGFPIQNTQE